MKQLKVFTIISLSIFMVQFTTPERIKNTTVEVYHCNGKDCNRKVFKTKLCKEACEKGGQKEAKKAMRNFVKKAKKITGDKIACGTCHAKLSGGYPLKKEGLSLFRKYEKAIKIASNK
ncbi:MAG: hypothetical protein ACPG19_10075 [Saprospiraceae bacterium]